MQPRCWMNPQSDYDRRWAKRDMQVKIAPRIRVYPVVAG